MERHGHLHLALEVRTGLLRMSAAAIDRLLRDVRERAGGRKRRHTPPSAATGRSVPVRTCISSKSPIARLRSKQPSPPRRPSSNSCRCRAPRGRGRGATDQQTEGKGSPRPAPPRPVRNGDSTGATMGRSQAVADTARIVRTAARVAAGRRLP